MNTAALSKEMDGKVKIVGGEYEYQTVLKFASTAVLRTALHTGSLQQEFTGATC